MKIPFHDAAPVQQRPVDQQYSTLNNDTGDSAVAKGFGDLAQGFDQARDVNRKLAKEAKEKADTAGTAAALAELQSSATIAAHGDSTDDRVTGTIDLTKPQTPDDANPGGTVVREHNVGFLATRGQEAMANSEPVLAGLDKKRQQILESLTSPEQKAAFTQHSAGIIDGFKRQVESHVAAQNEIATRASIQGMEDAALVAIRNDYTSEKTAADSSSPVEAMRRARALSPADGAATQAEWRSMVDVERIKGAMDARDWQGADDLYKHVKDQLGPKVDRGQIENAIATGLKGNARAHLDVEAQQGVDDIIKAGTEANGNINLADVDTFMSKVPAGPLRDEMQQRIGPAKEAAARRWKEKVDGYANAAGATYEKTLNLGAVDPHVKTWLQENAPDEWRKLRHDAEHELDRQRQRRMGNAAALREQTRLDEMERNNFVNDHPDPVDRAEADVDGYLRGKGVSPLGISRVKREKTKAIETVEKGDAVGEAEFIANVKAKTRGILPADPKAAKAKEAEIAAQAVKSYEDLRIKAKGKPAAADVEAEANRLTHVEATKPRSAAITWIPGIDKTLPEMTIEKQMREQKAAAGVITKKLAPGRYTDKNGKVWVVDEQGNKKAE